MSAFSYAVLLTHRGNNSLFYGSICLIMSIITFGMPKKILNEDATDYQRDIQGSFWGQPLPSFFENPILA